MPINMQGWEWVILIVLALLIFGGSRLAGAGKNAGRALREFKDETRQIKADDERARREEAERSGLAGGAAGASVPGEAHATHEVLGDQRDEVLRDRHTDDRIVDAELIDPEKRDRA